MNEKTTGQLLDILHNTHSPKDLQKFCLQHAANGRQPSFAEAFSRLLEEYQLTRAQVIQKSMLDRTYAYQITGGLRRPGRDKIIALGIAAGASLKEIQHLLTCAKEGLLYPRCARDAVLIYCIDHRCDILSTNEMLEDAEEALLL